ncbi:RidA family protein [Streptomyces sp. NRRL F-2664]|uniref:RidA family protein n=1 Tax=Streptomyces sp. NRRL F-2664 TaxID=1463842 RepID=UPI0004C87A1E|nr:Rid family hydrolase [Streptomyces sp. NRRL F-2664]
MAHAVVNPETLHDPTPFGYSHTAAVPAGTELVLVSGQYASGPDGAVVSADFAEQVERTFDNIGAALAAHGLGLADVVQLRTYVVDHDATRLGPIAAAVQARWGAEPPTQTLLGVAALATADMLIEVEAVAARP